MHGPDETAAAVLAVAKGWLGTPYRHQGSRKGVGCDCLGLVRGVWRELYGREPEPVPAYDADWAEAGGQDRLLDAARRHFIELEAGTERPGDLLLFRWRPHLPAKHAAILMASGRIIHSYEGHGVIASLLVPQWRARIAARFRFPARQDRPAADSNGLPKKGD